MYNTTEYTETLEGAAIPQIPQATEKIKRNDELARKSETRFVFFAANVIDTPIAMSLPFTAFGGIYLPHIPTLRTKVNKGMLYQCQITALKPRMIGINRHYLDPHERETWETSFILENGKFTPGGGYEDVTISDPLGALVYKMNAFPGKDVLEIVKPYGIGGVRGVVELTALRGKTDEEAHAVQLFFFPDWAKIQKGEQKLPQTLREIEAHLRTRLNFANASGDNALIQTGREMLKSVQIYQQWATEYLKRIEASMTAAKNHEFAYEYPYIAEMALAQTGKQRKDDLASTGADASRMLAEQMMEQNRLKQEELAFEREKLAFEREKMETEKLRLQAQLGISPVAPEVETEAETQTEVCADFNSKGEPCKAKVGKDENGALKQINGLFYCGNHPKSE